MINKMLRRSFLLASVIAFNALLTTPSQALDAAKNEPILVVKGLISQTNSDKDAVFDMAMLDALPGREASMLTPWTEGKTTFKGPLLRAVLEAVGAKGKTIVVKAINDYSAEIPLEDATNYDTILATQMNGAPMSIRDKGPLFLIYPFDSNPELANEKYFSRSVWQIHEIEIKD